VYLLDNSLTYCLFCYGIVYRALVEFHKMCTALTAPTLRQHNGHVAPVKTSI